MTAPTILSPEERACIEAALTRALQFLGLLAHLVTDDEAVVLEPPALAGGDVRDVVDVLGEDVALVAGILSRARTA